MKKKLSFFKALIIIIFLVPNMAKADNNFNQKVILQLKWHHQFQFAGYYAAKIKGFYKKYGIEVEIKEGDYTKSPIDDVIKGKANYGVSNSEILLARLNKKPIVLLAPIFQHSPLVFISRKTKNIFTPQDMVGKKIKFTKKTRDIELLAMLANEGLDFSDIVHIEAPIKKKDYFDENIDGLSAYLTNEPFFYETQNIEYNIINPVNYGIDFYGDCLFTSENEVKNNFERVKNFRKASIEGWDYALKNPDEIIEHILTELKSKKTREHLEYEAKKTNALIMPNLVEIGHLNEGRWKFIGKIFAEHNLAPKKFTLDKFIFEPEPKPDLKKIKITFFFLLIAIAVFFFCLITLIFFNRKLQKEINNRKAAEKSLRESEEKFRNIFQQSNEGIILQDFKGNIIDVNTSALRIMGYKKNEFITKNIADMILPSEEKKLLKTSVHLRKYGHALINLKAVKKSNEIIDITSSSAVLIVSNKKIIMNVVNDITKRLEYEQKLKFQAEILNQIDDMVTATDICGNITYVNQSELKRKKIESNSTLKGKITLFEPESDKNSAEKIIEITLKNGQWHGESVVLDQSGNKIFLFTRTVLIPDYKKQPSGIIFISTDITERKKTEQELLSKEKLLRQAQKIEAVGTLAGGIAHDFNNLLYIISGNCELLLLKSDKNIQKNISNILMATERGADLVKRLLAFSRKTESRLQPVSINQEIVRIKKMIDRVLPKMIDVKLVLERKEKYIKADQGQIEQVLINLCLNAKDVMPDGGRLIIKTRFVEYFDDSKLPFESRKNIPFDKYMLLSVEDSGSGMDDSTLERIFDPFFTTKSIGKGTGLGLSVIYGIVKSHKGFIECVSSKDKGSIFYILFPVTQERPSDNKVISDEASPSSGSETILIADDDENILSLTSKMLKKLGYKVISVNSGEQAVAEYKNFKNQIELVIIDIGMPGIGGKNAIKELLKINPWLKIIVASGYSSEGEIKDTLTMGVKNYIVKPCSYNALSKVVREVLDSKDK